MKSLYPVAIIIPNYNMKESADALCDYISANVLWPYELIVVDNASDIMPPSRRTALAVTENIQTTAAWLLGLSYAEHLARKKHEKFFAYWFLITSASFPADQHADMLTPVIKLMANNWGIAGVHHALTPDSTTHWTHLIDRGTSAPRRTWMLDNISVVYRAEWFDSIGRFDPRLYMAWGIDLETSYLARMEGKSLWIYDGLNVRKTTNIAYQMNRMHMSADERAIVATRNMSEVLTLKYGPNWEAIIKESYIDESWK